MKEKTKTIFVKHYSEQNGRKVWNKCQTGMAPSSPECIAFDHFVLANDEKVYLGKLYKELRLFISLKKTTYSFWFPLTSPRSRSTAIITFLTGRLSLRKPLIDDLLQYEIRN